MAKLLNSRDYEEMYEEDGGAAYIRDMMNGNFELDEEELEYYDIPEEFSTPNLPPMM